MKIIIFVVLVSTSVLCQDVTSHHQQQYLKYSQQPTLEPAPARPEPIKRAGYSISHGDAKSSVNVNLSPGFHQSEPIQLGAQDVSSGELQYHGISSGQQGFYQGQDALLQYQAPKHSFLTDLATKQYLNINPTNAKPEIISQDQSQPQQQLYNVGYSINIENSAPKLSFRTPMPKNAHSYRQQKLLNAEVITGTNKAFVEKPNSYTQNYDFAASNVQPSANYISPDQGKGQYAPNFSEKQSLTKVYADVKNTHGYTWKTISPNVEISGYHSLNDMSQHQPVQSQSFDHAGALGRSQGFDISNVVENGKTQYQPSAESQAYDINKALSEASSSNAQVSNIDSAPDSQAYDTSSSINSGLSGGDYSHGGDSSSIVDLKFDTSSQNSYPSYGGFSSQFKDLGFSGGPFKHNLFSSGSNFEFDKSLLDGFYKNYNPLFYSPEVTLPSPGIPKSININLHGAASHQIPSYNLKFSPPTHFKNSVGPSNSQLPMINQHYAFVQASAAEGQGQGQSLQPVSDDVKPVTEQQEDSQVQQSQQQVQQVAVQAPSNPNPANPNFKEQKGKGATEHKKYIPQTPVPVRQYGRPVYVNDKNYRMKTSLRPPPMIIIHQKY